MLSSIDVIMWEQITNLGKYLSSTKWNTNIIIDDVIPSLLGWGGLVFLNVITGAYDIAKWKYFPHYKAFVWPMEDSLHKGSGIYNVIWYTMPAWLPIRKQWFIKKVRMMDTGENCQISATYSHEPTNLSQKNGGKMSIDKPPENQAAMYHR